MVGIMSAVEARKKSCINKKIAEVEAAAENKILYESKNGNFEAAVNIDKMDFDNDAKKIIIKDLEDLGYEADFRTMISSDKLIINWSKANKNQKTMSGE